MSHELRAEIAMAISRLTQILIEDREEEHQPALRSEMVGGSQMNIWLDIKPAQVLTDSAEAVFVRGDLTAKYSYAGDLFALTPLEAISLGQALIAAGQAVTTGNVARIER